MDKKMKTIEGTAKNGIQYRFKVGFDLEFARRNNQEPYFSITGETWEAGKSKTERNSLGCGALTIGDYIPELAYLDKWHLCGTSTPMHYVANSMYHASDRDHNGLLKGEIQYKDEFSLKFSGFPFRFDIKGKELETALKNGFDFSGCEVAAIPHINRKGETYKFSDHYSIKLASGTILDNDWYKCQFNEIEAANQMLEALKTVKFEYSAVPTVYRVGEGKTPDLEAARSCAKWPDAELSDFTKEKLTARLPKLLKQFKKDIKKAGFEWPESVEIAV